MAQDATCQASAHLTTAAALRDRGLIHIPISGRLEPRDLAVIRSEFLGVVDAACPFIGTACCRQSLFAEQGLENLQMVMTNDYTSERDFDEVLFAALRGCLTGYQCEAAGNLIVLRSPGPNKNFAVGFARQWRDLIPQIKEEILRTAPSSSATAGLVASCQIDHAVCLFEKVGRGEKSEWKVKECFGVIELKSSETSCLEFPLSASNCAVRSVDLGSKHGALGQELLHTMGSVVLYAARNGMLKESFPIAVIAGRRIIKGKKPKLPSRLRWVSGRLHSPKVCGNAYTYSVDGFGRFHEKNSASDQRSAKQAVALYLDTMLSGLRMAIDVRDMRNRGELPQPCPASGLYLQVGKMTLAGVAFCASPISAAARIVDPENKKWSVHQGDLFRGRVNIHDILQQPSLAVADFRPKADPMGEVPVLVKVSSTAVHSLLIDPSETFCALQQLVRQGQPGLVSEMGSVLQAAISTDVGLITIMSDLSVNNEYTALTPEMHAEHLPALWEGFARLVKDVLLPMAETTVIHPDIRPGYDTTFNILFKLDDGSAKKVVTMKLIDLESLVFVNKWKVPIVKGKMDGRFLPTTVGWDATTYVWWQCVFIAYVWSKEMKAGDVGKGEGTAQFLKDVLLSRVTSKDWPQWLVGLRHVAVTEDGIDAATVLGTLAYLGKELFGG